MTDDPVVSPQVTIIIAAYNAATTIARAIESALAEKNVTQLIVVDDASIDASAEAATAADDGTGRLIVLRQPQNSGPSAARNRALELATGDWVGVLDADDFFLPGRITDLLAFANEGDLIADNMRQVTEDAVAPLRSLIDITESERRPIGFAEFVNRNVSQDGRQRGELGFIKPLMRRTFLETNDLRYNEALRLGEDFEFYARALGLGARLLLLPSQSYVSVVRGDSLSAQHSETDLRNLRDCGLALQRDLTLTKQERAALSRHHVSVDCRLQWRLLIIAVKTHNIGGILATFRRSFPVTLYLLRQLACQAYLRSVLSGRR